MKRTLNEKFSPCPVCGKKPYVKTYNLNYGVAYCKGTLFSRHPLIEVETEYCNPSELFRTLSVRWNGIQWERLNSLPITMEIKEVEEAKH